MRGFDSVKNRKARIQRYQAKEQPLAGVGDLGVHYALTESSCKCGGAIEPGASNCSRGGVIEAPPWKSPDAQPSYLARHARFKQH